MKERPILFSAPMVRALLEDRKTQTRLPLKKQPSRQCLAVDNVGNGEFVEVFPSLGRPFGIHGPIAFKCPYGQPGDRLWVRETFCHLPEFEGLPAETYYKADGGDDDDRRLPPSLSEYRWKPSIHMPRNLSRILLEVVSVRVERLRDISEADAVAEGVEPIKWPDGNILYPDYAHKAPNGKRVENCTPIRSFLTLWESINGRSSLEANPWVWVVEFRRVEP